MQTRRIALAVLSSLAATIISSGALAQPAPSSNYTSFEATSAKPVQLGYYASANKDCTLAPLPKIRVVATPKSGTLTVRRGALTTSNIPGCSGLKIPAQVAFYQARAGSTRTEHLTYEVTAANGETSAAYAKPIQLLTDHRPRLGASPPPFDTINPGVTIHGTTGTIDYIGQLPARCAFLAVQL